MINLPGFHPLRFFSKLRAEEKSVSYFVSGQWTIMTWNPSQTIEGSDASVFRRLRALPKNTSTLPFSGGAIGYCSYDFGCVLQGVSSRHRFKYPLARFHVYDHALLWDGKKIVVVGDPAFQKQVEAIHARPYSDVPVSPIEWQSTINKSSYQKKFQKVMRGIRDGDFYQLNLSYVFKAQTDLDHRRLFSALLEAHPAPCASYFEQRETAIISLSPERFVTIHKNTIMTCPIKGTRPRGRTPAEDRRLAADLLSSPKESAELNMITDLLRNDIGRVSSTGSVRVLVHRALQKTSAVWHTYSVIRGTLEKNIHPVDAFASLFPGGSITGCPKVAAMQEIRRCEDEPRGAYTGSMLMVSASGFLDSTILIRTIEARRSTLTLGMGGGIVADSECDDEYDETLKKAKPFLSLDYAPRYFRGAREVERASVSKLFDLRNKNLSGVFETMRTERGKICNLASHIRRLRESARLLALPVPSATRLRRQLLSAVKRSSLPSLRVKIVSTTNDVAIETRPLVTDPARAKGIFATILPLDRALPEAKALPYHREYALHQEADRRGCGEAFLRRFDGSIPEGAYSNIFFVKGGKLYTANTNILFGITRAKVLRVAKRLKIPVQYISPQEEDLHTADEIFITSSLRGITPVLELDQKKIGKGTVGTLTTKLMTCDL